MTFDDDFVLLNIATGPLRITCKRLGIHWPPPETLLVESIGMEFTRLRHSSISDKERAGMTRVCRGAEYEPKREQPQ